MNKIPKSCLHFDPVKIGHSENHNMRLGEIPTYVNQSLTHFNEHYVEKDLKPLDKAIRETYQKRVGQRMQDKQNPIKECSVNILSTTTMDDLKNLATELEKRYGIHCFQIHIHRDEGHNNKKFIDSEGKKRLVKSSDAEWMPNYHAHMLWDFTDQETGESLNRKIRSLQLSEIQTLVAEMLSMERGEKGSKKKRRSSQEQHLHGIEMDVEFAQEVLEQTKIENEILENRILEKEKEVAEIEQKVSVMNEAITKTLNDVEGLIRKETEDMCKEKSREIARLDEELALALEIENEVKDVPKQVTDGDGKTHSLSLFDRLKLWFGGEQAFTDFKYYNGDFYAKLYGMWDKLKLNFCFSKERRLTKSQNKELLRNGVKTVVQKSKGVKM
jgi:hypothetical protein